MKKLNHIIKIVMFLLAVLIISSCRGCGDIDNEGTWVMPKPPCEIYNHGETVIINESGRDILISKHSEKHIPAKSSITIPELTPQNYRLYYEYFGGRKNKVRTFTFDVCQCETTTVILPSEKHFRCPMSP